MIYRFINFTINEKGNVEYLKLPISGNSVNINYNDNQSIESFDIDDKTITSEEYNNQITDTKATRYESNNNKAYSNPNTIEGPSIVDEYIEKQSEDEMKPALRIVELSILDKKGKESLLSFSNDRLKRMETKCIDTTFLYKNKKYYQPLVEKTLEISLENAIAAIVVYEDSNGERYIEEVLNE